MILVQILKHRGSIDRGSFYVFLGNSPFKTDPAFEEAFMLGQLDDPRAVFHFIRFVDVSRFGARGTNFLTDEATDRNRPVLL